MKDLNFVFDEKLVRIWKNVRVVFFWKRKFLMNIVKFDLGNMLYKERGIDESLEEIMFLNWFIIFYEFDK